MVKTHFWVSPMKLALSAGLSLLYTLSSCHFAAAQTASGKQAAGGQSLIESALEGKYQAPTDTTSGTSSETTSKTDNAAASKTQTAKGSNKNSHHKNKAEMTAASPTALPSAPLMPSSGENIPLRGEMKPATSIKPATTGNNSTSASTTKAPASVNNDPNHKPVVRLVKPVKPSKPTVDQSAGRPIVKLVKPAPAAVPAAVAEPSAADAPEHKVTLTPVTVNDEQERIPDPVAQAEAPIHSSLPYHQPRVPLFDVKVGEEKVDKSYSVDTTYRGKPTLPTVQTVSFGFTPTWAIATKRQIASALPGAATVGSAPSGTIPVQSGSAAPSTSTSAATNGSNPGATAASKTSGPQQLFEVNVRILTRYQFKQTDTLWVYPYPPKPPKQVIPNPLPNDDGRLKPMLLSSGYTARPDETRPYPSNGWRWLKALNNAMEKAHEGVPHTMFTMYPWVNKMCPYVRAECTELNLVEEKRSERYAQASAEYESRHADLEAQATARGFIPVEFKFTAQGVAQATLPQGNWWVAVSRSYPGLKFYWLVPISCNDEKIINIQLNEANALVIGGAW